MPYWPCEAGFSRERKHADLAGLLQIRLPEAILLAQALWEHCRGQEAGMMQEADVLHVARQEAATYGYRLPAAVDIIAGLVEAGHLRRMKSGILRMSGFDRHAGKAARAAKREKNRWRESKRRNRMRQKREMSRGCPKKNSEIIYENVPRDMTGTVGKRSSSYQKKIYRGRGARAGAPPPRGGEGRKPGPRDLEAMRRVFPEFGGKSVAEIRRLAPALAAEIEAAEALKNPVLPLIGVLAPAPASKTGTKPPQGGPEGVLAPPAGDLAAGAAAGAHGGEVAV